MPKSIVFDWVGYFHPSPSFIYTRPRARTFGYGWFCALPGCVAGDGCRLYACFRRVSLPLLDDISRAALVYN